MSRSEPIEALFADDAKHLIGKSVLCANDKEGLGYYATLIRIESGNKPFVCILNNHLNEEKQLESRWRWIVEDKI
jgi:hypothetical protein